MNPNLVSVIIPTYNRGSTIAEALHSVESSTKLEGFECEVLVLDDGSDDKTKHIVSNEFPLIKYIELTHSGKPSVVRNAGITSAGGSLIAFQDSDDLWTDDKFIKQLDSFKDPDVVLSYGNAEYIDPQGNKSGVNLIPEGVGASGDVFDKVIAKDKQPFPTNTVIVRKSALDRVGGFNERLVIATDTDCWIRLAAIGKFHYADRVLGYVRRGDDNISSRAAEGSGDFALFKHETNRAMMFKDILETAELTDEQREKLAARLVEQYDYVSLISKKMTYQSEDKFRKEYGHKSSSSIKRAVVNQRALAFTQSVRALEKLNPSYAEKLKSVIKKLR